MEKNSLEVRRQVFHLCLGVVILGLLIFKLLDLKILVAVFALGIIFALLSLRFRIGFIVWFLDRFERPNVFPGKGALFFFLGTILSLVLFPKDVAFASIAILTFGDSIAPLAGIYFGRVRSRLNTKRFVEGFVVGLAVAFFAASFFVPLIPAFLGSFFALAFEFLEIRFKGYAIDDNLLVPVIAGAVMNFVMVL